MNAHNLHSIEQPSLSGNSEKVLLVTLYAPIGNYGNALQLYALYEILQASGFEVERIRCPLVEI